MKITEIEIIDAQLDAQKSRGWNPAFVVVRTDEGVAGIGEMAPAYSPSIQAAIRHLAVHGQDLIGVDPFRIQSVTGGLLSTAFGMPSLECGHVASAIDMALHDLKGKALGIPAIDLLGGRVRDSIRVYANGWCYRKETPIEYAEAAKGVVEAGFTAMKFDPFRYAEGGGDWAIQRAGQTPRSRWVQTSLRRLEAVRSAVGPEVDILLEAHAKFDTPTAEYLADAFSELDLYWYEEPTHSANVAMMKRVADAIAIPLATGERLVGRDAFRPFIEAQACSVVQPDLGMAGGLTECRAIAEHAQQYGLFFAPHNAGGPVCTAASVQLDLATPNFLIQETYPFRPPEYDDFVLAKYEDRIWGGFLTPPDAPGLGVELDEDRLKSAPRILIR